MCNALSAVSLTGRFSSSQLLKARMAKRLARKQIYLFR
jgi:hypothetical protein